MADATIKNHAAFIWSVADLRRGDYKPSGCSKPSFHVVLRHLDCVLDSTEAAVWDPYKQPTFELTS